MKSFDFYDIETEPLIDLSMMLGQPRHLVDKCLITFSKEIYSYLRGNYECEKIAEITSCNWNTPIYRLDYKGEKIAFYLSDIGSTNASVLAVECHHLTGATKYVMFGSCGSLDREKTKGRFIIPTESFRGDGTSHYYAPPADYIAVKNGDTLAQAFDKLSVPYVRGRIWTTESMLRETKGLVAERQSEGCIAVEMEVAGVESVCDFYGLKLYPFLEAGDVLSDSGYEFEGLNAANHNVGKALIALEAALLI